MHVLRPFIGHARTNTRRVKRVREHLQHTEWMFCSLRYGVQTPGACRSYSNHHLVLVLLAVTVMFMLMDTSSRLSLSLSNSHVTNNSRCADGFFTQSAYYRQSWDFAVPTLLLLLLLQSCASLRDTAKAKVMRIYVLCVCALCGPLKCTFSTHTKPQKSFSYLFTVGLQTSSHAQLFRSRML